MRMLGIHPRFSCWYQGFLNRISGGWRSFADRCQPSFLSLRVVALLAFAQHPEAASMAAPDSTRPPWLQWLILLIFLWSSWQLAGLWFQRFHG
jgi:hypothetical protein